MEFIPNLWDLTHIFLWGRGNRNIWKGEALPIKIWKMIGWTFEVGQSGFLTVNDLTCVNHGRLQCIVLPKWVRGREGFSVILCSSLIEEMFSSEKLSSNDVAAIVCKVVASHLFLLKECRLVPQYLNWQKTWLRFELLKMQKFRLWMNPFHKKAQHFRLAASCLSSQPNPIQSYSLLLLKGCWLIWSYSNQMEFLRWTYKISANKS